MLNLFLGNKLAKLLNQNKLITIPGAMLLVASAIAVQKLKSAGSAHVF